MEPILEGQQTPSKHSPDLQISPGVHVRYHGEFQVSKDPIIPIPFTFTPKHVTETFVSRSVHEQALKHYRVYCDDFILVSGSLEHPEKVFLVIRSEEPLKGALWPIGGRAVNCPSNESSLSELWNKCPLDASLLLSIYRESKLQPADINQIRNLGYFDIVFQNPDNPDLFNRDHPAGIHAVWVKDEAISGMDLSGAMVEGGSWYSNDEIEALYKQGKILPHVKLATDAIFQSRFVKPNLNLSDYSI